MNAILLDTSGEIVEIRDMHIDDFNHMYNRNCTTPKGNEDGFWVEASNQKDGSVSHNWMSRDVMESMKRGCKDAYEPCLSFEEALIFLKAGYTLRRKEWESWGLQNENSFDRYYRIVILEYNIEGHHDRETLALLYMDDTVSNFEWKPDLRDMYASDWYIVSHPSW